MSQVHDLPPHCDKPGCLVGVLVGRCRCCGFIAPVNGDCPATEDLSVEPTDGLVVTFGEPLILTSEALKSGGRVG
jgi:hypothetical protein